MLPVGVVFVACAGREPASGPTSDATVIVVDVDAGADDSAFPSPDGLASLDVSLDVPAMLDGSAATDAEIALDTGAGGSDGAACTTATDGSVCGTAQGCNAAPTCQQGVCVPHLEPDGTSCSTGNVCKTGACKAGSCTATNRPDGYKYSASSTDVCCAGAATATTSNSNCGVCGVVCNTAKGQSCSVVDTHYVCTGCASNADCSLGCCGTSPIAHCTPSMCTTTACASPNKCPDGSHCEASTIDYCTY
jgi:hypothetical protein